MMAGMQVVTVACDSSGNIDRRRSATERSSEHRETLAALMVTYPSTHGVFEESIEEICAKVHAAGGMVYMDGANMNAQVGLCRPARHRRGRLPSESPQNLLHSARRRRARGRPHLCRRNPLAPFLPGHSVVNHRQARNSIGEISEAPWGSASILVISWMFIAMMGADGLLEATKVAILNANYIAARLSSYFPVLYKGRNGRVAHECILDIREWKQRAGIEVEDIAKRLMDYGFHAPTMSWPVPGTLMIEPTESESKGELDRFCEAMIAIHGELCAIERGELSRTDNPLKNAPHTAAGVTSDSWAHAYGRELAAYPAPWLKEHKFWPAVARIDNVYGDRNVFWYLSAS